MRSVRQQPVFFGRIGGSKPIFTFLTPGWKIADLRHLPVFAHPVQHTREFGLFRQPLVPESEEALEGQICEAQHMARVKLGNPGGHHVQKVTLCIGHFLGFRPSINQILNIDCQPGNTRLTQGNIKHPQLAPFPVQGGGNNPLAPHVRSGGFSGPVRRTFTVFRFQ